MAAHGSSVIREAVGLFQASGDMEAAIDDLQENGFDRASISLLDSAASGVRDGPAGTRPARELEDDPGAPRAAYVSSESIGAAKGALIGGMLAVNGAIAAGISVSAGAGLAVTIAVTAAAGVVAMLAGYALARQVEDRHERTLQSQLDRGGLLVWVRTRNSREEHRAMEVLIRNGARDVHVHDMTA
ncbi:MAG: hypothetical protein V2I51_23430 [Anderseniella sp.]|nr:hypothetical protein [Anderseniella sp.]